MSGSAAVPRFLAARSESSEQAAPHGQSIA